MIRISQLVTSHNSCDNGVKLRNNTLIVFTDNKKGYSNKIKPFISEGCLNSEMSCHSFEMVFF